MARGGARLRAAARVLAVVAVAAMVAIAGVTAAGLFPDTSSTPVEGGTTRPELLEGRNHVATIGVASQNVHHDLNRADTRHDMRRIFAKKKADIVGWQEAHTEHFVDLHPRFVSRGWQTAFFPEGRGSQGNAISWRRDEFALMSRDQWRMHPGAGKPRTPRPFAGRYVTTVLLRHRDSGLTVRVVNTHVNHHIETGQGFQQSLNARYAKRHLAWLAKQWDNWSGDVVVGTGDYNFDYADDSAARPTGGISDLFADRALSSFEALGHTDVVPTLRSRWIDYVFLATQSLDTGRGQFVNHRSLDGFRSDHRPMLARVRLYD